MKFSFPIITDKPLTSFILKSGKNLLSIFPIYGYMGILIFLSMLINYIWQSAEKGMLLPLGENPCGCRLPPYVPRIFAKSIFRLILSTAHNGTRPFPV